MATAPANDWFLRQWMSALAMRQADLMARTGWDKRKASHLYNGSQQYNRSSLNEAAMALNISPWELLLHPEDAMAIRRLRADALQIAADTHSLFQHAPPEPGRTGTEG